MFLPVKNMQNQRMNNSKQLFQLAKSFTAVCFTQCWSTVMFKQKQFTRKCCIVMRLRFDGMFNYCSARN